jgi:hypothetical protein
MLDCFHLFSEPQTFFATMDISTLVSFFLHGAHLPGTYHHVSWPVMSIASAETQRGIPQVLFLIGLSTSLDNISSASHEGQS